MLPPVRSPLSLKAVARGWLEVLQGEPAHLDEAHSLLSGRYGARQLLLTDSGTTALAIALKLAVAHRPQTPRIGLPAWACYDLATAADTAGVEVLLYDLDPSTLGPDWNSLGQVLTSGVAAVVVVHPYGLPIDVCEVSRRAAETGAMVIEDAAQATGAWLSGRRLGSWGDLAVLSFGRGKGWTGGGGGALLLNSDIVSSLPSPEELAPAHGALGSGVKLTAQWLLARPWLYALPASLPFLQLGQTAYRAPEALGRMSAQSAGVLLATAPLMDQEFDRRRVNAASLRKAVHATPAGTLPILPEDAHPSWLRLPLLLSERFLAGIELPAARRLGIMPGYPLPLSRLPGFESRRAQGAGEFPGAELLARQLVTLPTHGQLSTADLERLKQWLHAA